MSRGSLVFALLAGCSVNSGRPVSQSIDPTGGTITVTSTEDPLLAGTVLSIPAGALSEMATIQIQRGRELTIGAETAVGPSVLISPETILLMKALSLTLPHSPARGPASSGLVLITSDRGNRSETTGTDININDASALATMAITHLGIFELAAAKCVSAGVPSDLGGTGSDGATPSDAGATDGGEVDMGGTAPTVLNCTAVTM